MSKPVTVAAPPEHRRKPSDFDALMNAISSSSKELPREELKKNVIRIKKD